MSGETRSANGTGSEQILIAVEINFIIIVQIDIDIPVSLAGVFIRIDIIGSVVTDPVFMPERSVRSLFFIGAGNIGNKVVSRDLDRLRCFRQKGFR